MRTTLLPALALLLALHLAAPLVAPRLVTTRDLALYVGGTVALEGHVLDAWPGERVTRLTLEDAAGQASVLVRGDPPPLGASVRVVGEASVDDSGFVLWARGRPEVLGSASPAPVALAVVLRDPLRFSGRPVAVVGAWDPALRTLSTAAGRLAVEPHEGEPGSGTLVVWGTLRYVERTASYRLDAIGWQAWEPTAR